jgi:hypothetical protein
MLCDATNLTTIVKFRFSRHQARRLQPGGIQRRVVSLGNVETTRRYNLEGCNLPNQYHFPICDKGGKTSIAIVISDNNSKVYDGGFINSLSVRDN